MDGKRYDNETFFEDEKDLRHLEDPLEESGLPQVQESRTDGRRVSAGDAPSLYRIRILHSSEIFVFSAQAGEDVPAGALVVVPTRYGRDLGRCLGRVGNPEGVSQDDIQQIARLATEEDIRRNEENQERERTAFDVCRSKIEKHRLDMKLVSVHYVLEDPKVLFFFTAENRVDFRELVKDLVSVFKMRIELRQIGVRDEARVTGGCGVCGRVLCCHGLTDKLKPVSIKMAKEQNLSLNSMKISGPCGRLLCCLAYEYDFYHEEKAQLPSEGSRIPFDGSLMRVGEVNLFSRVIRLTGEGGRTVELPFCRFQIDDGTGKWVVAASPCGEGEEE